MPSFIEFLTYKVFIIISLTLPRYTVVCQNALCENFDSLINTINMPAAFILSKTNYICITAVQISLTAIIYS